MDKFLSRFYICFFLQVLLVLRTEAVAQPSTNSTLTTSPSQPDLNSWDLDISESMCPVDWTLYQPTSSCFRSYQSVFVQRSALDYCSMAESKLATVSKPELDCLAAMTWVAQRSSQTWWMGYQMRLAEGNSTEWELVDLWGSGDDLSWIDLKPPNEVADGVEETELCVVLSLQPEIKQTSWHLRSCTEKSMFLCKQAAHKVCFDRKGNQVGEAESYIPPGSDACTSCRCVNGQPEMCLTSMCAQPHCEHFKPDPEKCCQYSCTNGGDDNTTYMSDNMRWVLTMLTSFVLLGMMLFMVYRMRQKRIAYLRYRAQQMRESSMMDFEPGSGPPPIPNLDDFDGAVFREPPPPYSFLKDERHIPTEQPPPYISTVGVPMDVNRNRDRRGSFQQNNDGVALLEGSISSEPNTPTLITGVPEILPSPPAYMSSDEISNVSSLQTEQSTPGGESSTATTPTHQMILPSINTTV